MFSLLQFHLPPLFQMTAKRKKQFNTLTLKLHESSVLRSHVMGGGWPPREGGSEKI
jgi:hypothetical protein